MSPQGHRPAHSHRPAAQRGLVLISSLLLLLVMTIFAMAMFRSYGVQERIAGNLREKQRALHAAEAAQQYAEWWLSQGDNAQSLPVDCSMLLDANLGQGQICVTAPTNVTTVPWQVSGADVGVAYTPPSTAGMNITTTSAFGTYYARPRFYITYLGNSATVAGAKVFQIDAAGYGATGNAIAVVESTYSVATHSSCLSCSP